MARLSKKRVTAILLAVALLVTGAMILEPMMSSATASVKIGQATNDERGKIRGGKAGDQTGGEVGYDKWTYSSKKGAYNNWRYVIRAKDPAIAKKLADSMKKACLNNHIGYDQQSPDRFSCYDEAKAVGWKLDKITKDCETTCASIVSVCLNAAGIKVDRYWDSSLVYKDLKATGKFNIFTSAEFTASPDLLEAGDILVSPGAHTVMVVESPNSPGSVVAATPANKSSSTVFKAGKEYQLKEFLYVRTGAGNAYPVKAIKSLSANAKLYAISKNGKAVLNKGTVVTCLKVKGDWIKIPSGWVRAKHGKTANVVEYKDTAAQRAQYEKALVSNLKKTTTTAKATTKTTAKSTPLVIKKGKNYVLKEVLNVRTGPGTNYKIVKRSNLTKDAKKHATMSSDAKLKKGTVVTCLQVSGNWMRIPSGWICCKPGNVAASK